jgi:hypothetical protein
LPAAHLLLPKQKETTKQESLPQMNYLGWKISYFPIGSQIWKASRFGVTLCANSKELLMAMIARRK